ncbi:MAG: SulP family inorganic anion transporter [Bacteroidia bacterium]|nr:SulP family inorganic anion transporter [Bacteroidia bacterium]
MPQVASTRYLRYGVIVRRDFLAGLVVALVALPLCIGIALASGTSASAGLLSGMIGGLVVPLLSRSPLGISGPAAGLIVLVADAMRALSPSEWAVSVAIAGATQLLLGALQGDVIGYFIPNAVIHGMLAGIGGIILIRQMPSTIGYQALPLDEAMASLSFFSGSIHIGGLIIGIVSLSVLIVWEYLFVPAQLKKWLPGPLVAIGVGSATSLVMGAFWPGVGAR